MSDPLSIKRATDRLMAEQDRLDDLMQSGSFAALGGKLAALDARDLRRLLAFVVTSTTAAEKDEAEGSEEEGAEALQAWVLRAGGEAYLIRLFGDGQGSTGKQRRGGKKRRRRR